MEARVKDSGLKDRVRTRAIGGKGRERRDSELERHLFIGGSVLRKLKLTDLTERSAHQQLEEGLASIARMVNTVAAAEDDALRMWEPPRQADTWIPCVLAVAVTTESVAHLGHTWRKSPAGIVGRN